MLSMRARSSIPLVLVVAALTIQASVWGFNFCSMVKIVSPSHAVSKKNSNKALSFRYEAEDCLAQSLLIFLFADLRRLSTQGRINTKFEVLTVASDDAVRNTAARWSAMPGVFQELKNGKNEGISPAHIMAALLVEMRMAVLEQRKRNEDDETGPEEMSLLDTFVDPNGVDKLLDDMDTNLRAYSTQLLRDLKGIPDLDSKGLLATTTRKRESGRSAPKGGNANLELFGKLGDRFFAMGKESTSKAMSEDELLDYIQEILHSREQDKLDFMSAFFEDDTVSQLSVKSKARFVWMNDWHPTSDLLYAISVDQEKKQVTVIFRGAQNEADFNTCKDAELIDVPNPVKEGYEGKTETIKVHAGYYKYLFRRRKDTSIRKYDEIVDIMMECASRLGDDYKVVVTGLSLGGALSTVFSLFASADERFTKNGPLKVYTFGSPYTAGRTAADCYHHQEMTRKVLMARFYNVRDCISHWPPNQAGDYKHMGIKIKLHRPRPQFLWQYLPPVRKPEVTYEYIPSSEEDSKHAQLGRSELFWFNLPLPWNIINVHLLPEHQRRALMARVVCQEEDPNDESTIEDLYEELVYNKY